MLLELRAENYAVIDHAVAGFGPGLNLLTGETGAGKSILIDALALLLGDKGSADVVRHGAEKAVVSCVFETTPGAEAVLEANGIDVEGSEILLRREIAAGGKGRVFVNNQPATVAVLRQLAPELALVHAQGETLGSFDQAQQRGLLDRYAGIDGASTAVSTAFAAWHATREKLEEMQSAEQDRLRMADLWSFQRKEIAQAEIAGPDEDSQLETEKRVLANAEKLYAAAMGAHEFLYESENSAESSLRAALKQVEELARYDDKFAEAVQQLTAARAVVEDVSSTTRDYAEGINASPERLGEIEDRLALLDKLKRKYAEHPRQSGSAETAGALAEVIAYGEEVAQKLGEIENRDAILAGLRQLLAEDGAAYVKAATELTAQRTAAAKKLEKLAEAQINDLAMKVRFEIEVAAQQEHSYWTAHGWDSVTCRIATNAGEPLKPLDEIASGGEMSRVMLALKVSVEEGAASKSRKKMPLPRTLVFDEIDIGIGGRAAEAVGQKLRALAKGQQVICISHLPQIAAFAEQHFLIEKAEKDGRTRTSVRQMSENERTQEIARMLSGAKLTETSLKHAEQMMKAADRASRG
jgi:DNA repair protein RecN (Recombination protein N)